MPATPLRHRRIDQDLTQLELALKAGISPTRVSLLERQIVAPTSDEAGRLADALGCVVEELFPPSALLSASGGR